MKNRFATAKAPTMLFCNPNACYYEYLNFQTEWLDYYVNLGINLVIWNYRGYGRSQGRRTLGPTSNMKDGLKIFEFMKNSQMAQGKLGVHGESLGGSIASYIARHSQVDFIFADRTFASLPAVVYWSFGGRIIEGVFRFLTRWNEGCWENYYLAE